MTTREPPPLPFGAPGLRLFLQIAGGGGVAWGLLNGYFSFFHGAPGRIDSLGFVAAGVLSLAAAWRVTGERSAWTWVFFALLLPWIALVAVLPILLWSLATAWTAKPGAGVGLGDALAWAIGIGAAGGLSYSASRALILGTRRMG